MRRYIVGSVLLVACAPNPAQAPARVPTVTDDGGHSREDARALRADVDAARTRTNEVASRIEAAIAQLSARPPESPRFPSDLSAELEALPIELDGATLGGRSFTNFSGETSRQLVDFVVAVVELREHLDVLRNSLGRLEKPITQQLTERAAGTHFVRHVVFLGGAHGRDKSGNYVGQLATLVNPIAFSGEAPPLAIDYTAVVAGMGSDAFEADAYPRKTRGLEKPSAVYLSPASFDGVCPNESRGAIVQLGIQLQRVVLEIRGDDPSRYDGTIETTAPGLLTRAEILSKALEAADLPGHRELTPSDLPSR